MICEYVGLTPIGGSKHSTDFAAFCINEDAGEKSVSGCFKSATHAIKCVKPSKAAKKIAALRLKKGMVDKKSVP